MKTQSNSGFVLTAFDVLSRILTKFITKSDRFQNNFTTQSISNFLSITCAGMLHSYGADFHGKKEYHIYSKKEALLFQRMREIGFFGSSPFIVDSGGFQIALNKLSQEESELLPKLYYEFLEEYHSVIDRAFILDISPSEFCTVFRNEKDVYETNLSSYLKANSLPKEAKEKIIYIHHFRTPKTWLIFNRILRENEFFREFQYFSAAGIVANIRSDVVIPCMLYTLPLVVLLNECKKYGRKSLNFHMLGGATFRDVFFYELFKKHVKKCHDIDLEITYDSSGIFKAFSISRYLYLPFEGVIYRVDLRTPNLEKRFRGEMKVIDLYRNVLGDFAKRSGFGRIDMSEIYDREGAFFEDIRIYSMLYMLDQYAEIQRYCQEEVEKIYGFYESGDRKRFVDETLRITSSMNEGKMTTKQKAKSYSVGRTLDLLRDLDEDFCWYIVVKYLSDGEFSYLRDDNEFKCL